MSWCTDQGCRAQAQRRRRLAASFSLRGACSCSQEAAGGCAAHARRQRADVRGLCTLGNDGRRWPPTRAATAACVPCVRLGLSARCARSAAGRSPASSPSSTRNPASPGRLGAGASSASCTPQVIARASYVYSSGLVGPGARPTRLGPAGGGTPSLEAIYNSHSQLQAGQITTTARLGDGGTGTRDGSPLSI